MSRAIISNTLLSPISSSPSSSPMGSSPQTLAAFEPNLRTPNDDDDDDDDDGRAPTESELAAARAEAGGEDGDEDEEERLDEDQKDDVETRSKPDGVDEPPSPVMSASPAASSKSIASPSPSSPPSRTTKVKTTTKAKVSSSSPSPSSPPSSTLTLPLHYSTHLYHHLDSVLLQSDRSRAQSRHMLAFLRGKAELDRSYSAKLLSLTAKFNAATFLPARAKDANSALNGLCVFRNFHSNAGLNHATLATRLDESVSDVLESEVQESVQTVSELVAQTKDHVRANESAQDELDESRLALGKACSELENFKQKSIDKAYTNAATASTKSAYSSLLGGIVSAISSSAESLTRKMTAAEHRYVSAIKSARSARFVYDKCISEKLAEFEQAESDRMTCVIASMKQYAKLHAQVYSSHARNAQSVLDTLSRLNPELDAQNFVAEILAGKNPRPLPPLPTYNPPSVGATVLKGVAQPLTERQRQTLQSRPAEVDGEDEDEENEATDSDEEQDELVLSETDDVDELSSSAESASSQFASSATTDASAAELDVVALSTPALAASSAAAAGATPGRRKSVVSELDAILALFTRIVDMPSSATVLEKSPMEPEYSLVAGMLHTTSGRAAMAVGLKQIVNSFGGDVIVVQNDDPANIDDASADPSAAHTSSAASALAAQARKQLRVSQPAFDHFASLLLLLINAAQGDLHVQPVMSVLETSRHIVCEDSNALVSSSSSSFTPTLFSRLFTHPFCSSLTLYELSFFLDLDARWSKHAAIFRWQTDDEQSQRRASQRTMCARLIAQYATMMMRDEGKFEDRQIVAFIDKMANVNQLEQSDVAKLLTLKCFVREGITDLPSATTPVSTRIVDDTTKAAMTSVPVALPVAAPTVAKQ